MLIRTIEVTGNERRLAPGKLSERLVAPLIASGARQPGPSRSRVWAARILAVTADALQFALLPLVIAGGPSPIDNAIDVVTGVALTALVGFHWAFVPTFHRRGPTGRRHGPELDCCGVHQHARTREGELSRS
jgi:hypothetical protein